ncbi:RraA family protein [Herbiconiux sp. VKM Ac-2851]|uniref:RraA family protein n=1 Tax=Herbiconiux sp. VKM Ac-2851 TaxID=2739025 RepID=UPI0015660380|nr:RraA family protein [Herbiconiux sp. VKM Ac-2851]NQX33560.1 RraA family protein [Herbiconiux sp. VKM Ac-2851]
MAVDDVPASDSTAFGELTTAHVADALVRLGLPVRCAPPGVRPLLPGRRVAGPARPVRHSGSVDVFLEALTLARPGEVLVVDNGGRDDEACVGDLVALEVAQAGLAAIVIWGLHRDTAELREIGLPVFSAGSLPTGPLRLDPQAPEALLSARLGSHLVTVDDLVLADDDGIVLVPRAAASDVAGVAAGIRDTERGQAERMHGGTSLREQTRFAAYLDDRDRTGITFRQHLRRLGGAIEE